MRTTAHSKSACWATNAAFKGRTDSDSDTGSLTVAQAVAITHAVAVSLEADTSVRPGRQHQGSTGAYIAVAVLSKCLGWNCWTTSAEELIDLGEAVATNSLMRRRRVGLQH